MREFSRAPVAIEIDVIVDGLKLSAEYIRNVSMGGVCIGPCRPLPPPGAACQVRLYLGGRASGVCIEVTGEIAHVADAEVGIKFTEIAGADSYHHLQQLVLLNSEDPGTVEDELTRHLGLNTSG